MCGIFGKFGQRVHLNKEEVDKQFQFVYTRGPDGRGLIEEAHCTIGHTLLAIQDPGNASQPMYSRSKKSLIAFNGEIYNFRELASEFNLINLQSKSDTEVVLELLEAEGLEVVNKFEGMFAFAFYNLKAKEITFCRDQYGEKPFYYASSGQNVYFASNPQSVRNLLKYPPKVNTQNLPHFFRYQYLPEGETLYSGIEQVIPGTCVTFDLGLHRRIDIFKEKKEITHSTFSSAFSLSVKSCMIADVPVGLSLSGGVDSTIILCEIKKLNEDVKTFTVSFDKHNQDTIFARRASDLFKSEHHEVFISDTELPDLIYHVLSNQPQPFGDSSIVPAYALAKYAKQFVKVLISGDGADEVLSGYDYYRKYANEFQKSSKLYSEYLSLKFEISILKWLYAKKDYSRVNRIRELDFILSKKSAIDLWHEDISILNDRELQKMGFSSKCIKKSRREFSRFSGIQSVMQWDRLTYLPGDILLKSDTAGMMASLEVRTPFLNSNLVNWAREIDFTQRISKQTLLMKEYEGQIPSEFFTRKKQGFGAPLKKWLEIPEVNNLFMDTVGNKRSKVYKYINFRKGIKASRINAQTKWNLLALGLWLEKND